MDVDGPLSATGSRFSEKHSGRRVSNRLNPIIEDESFNQLVGSPQRIIRGKSTSTSFPTGPLLTRPTGKEQRINSEFIENVARSLYLLSTLHGGPSAIEKMKKDELSHLMVKLDEDIASKGNRAKEEREKWMEKAKQACAPEEWVAMSQDELQFIESCLTCWGIGVPNQAHYEWPSFVPDSKRPPENSPRRPPPKLPKLEDHGEQNTKNNPNYPQDPEALLMTLFQARGKEFSSWNIPDPTDGDEHFQTEQKQVMHT